MIVGAVPGSVVSNRFPPSIPPVRALDDAILYSSVSAPDFPSNSSHASSSFSSNNNSTPTFAAWSRPAAVVDLPPFVVSVSEPIHSDTSIPALANKRCLSNDNPPRKRQRLSLSLESPATPSQRGVSQPTPLNSPPLRVATGMASLAVPSVGPLASLLSPAPLVVLPLPVPPLKRQRSSLHTQASLPTRRLPHRACKRASLTLAPPDPVYLVTPRISMPGVLLGLSTSDIPGAGLGVFLRNSYAAGTRLATYGGRALTPTELASPHYDTTYVWSDTNQADLLQKRGLRPLILDANPRFSPLDWGGMINDGLTRPANVSLVRYRNQVYVTLLVDGTAGEELYLEYGGPYWQDRFASLPHVTQDGTIPPATGREGLPSGRTMVPRPPSCT